MRQQNWEMYKRQQIMSYPKRRRRKQIIIAIVVILLISLAMYMMGMCSSPKNIVYV